MTDGYTPTTDEVCEGYVTAREGTGDIIPVEVAREWAHDEFARWLSQVKAEAKAEALEEAARAVNQDLADRFFAAGGEAEEWTMHKRKTWADGASMALHEVRNRAAAIRAASTN